MNRTLFVTFALAAACSSSPDEAPVTPPPDSTAVDAPAPPAADPAPQPALPQMEPWLGLEQPPPPEPPPGLEPPAPPLATSAPPQDASARPSSAALEAQWTPVFAGLSSRYAATKQARQRASEEHDSKLTLSNMATTDGVAAKQRVDQLKAELQRLDEQLRSIEQEYAAKQEEARRAGAPAIVFRNGL